ncbi:MAG: methyltransferase domain-containing protein [Thermoplasmata archaeon]|nr:methyltransferase domain-containing protein [Thermoplasmata archaeon]
MTKSARMYDELASYYDRIYSEARYGSEARRVRAIVQRFGPARARTLLDVACGTGGHLQYFRRWYDAQGLDASAAMLRLARQRLPRVPFTQGRMESFDLGQEFDVITCLFSAIGYARTLPALETTLRNFARHLRPGGVVIIEPWLAPEEYRVGHSHLITRNTPELRLARLSVGERRGNESIIDFHFLIATPGGPVRYLRDPHVMGLFTVPDTLERMRRAGLQARHFRRGLGHGHDRGLFVGIRPADGSKPSPARARNRRRTKRPGS